MVNKTTAGLSARWHAPYLTQHENGEHWTANLKYRLTDAERRAGLETAVYGPTEDACRAETHRQDRAWCEYPLRRGDRDGARERLRFLASGGADGGAA